MNNNRKPHQSTSPCLDLEDFMNDTKSFELYKERMEGITAEDQSNNNNVNVVDKQIEPGTWKLLEGTDRIYSIGKNGTLGTHIATIAYNDKETAQLICKAVNNHSILLEAVKKYQELVEGLINATPTGEARNKFCDANIYLLGIIQNCEQ